MTVPPTDPDGPSPHRAAIGRSVTAVLEANPFVGKVDTGLVQLYHYQNFLSRTQCNQLIRLIDSGAYPSEVLPGASHSDDFRTSYSCDFSRDHPEIRRLDKRFAALTGQPPSRGETLQGQRYDPGQHFLAHRDYFRGNQEHWPLMHRSGGQRTWTAMIYLNEVEQGGDTWFTVAGICVTPVRGLLIVWNNMSDDGSPNFNSGHEGMQVTAGTKYVVTKWYREFDYADIGARTY